MRSILISSLVILIFTCILGAQQRHVDPTQTYERVFAAVPLIGQGTFADPQRPMFAPLPSQMKPGDRTGIIAFHHVVSDDGRFALVEFVFHNRTALAPVMASLSGQAAAQIFDKAKDSNADIEKAFKVFKKDFDLNTFKLRVP